MMEAIRHSSRVLTAPAPDVLLVGFDASAINYRARFWIDDYGPTSRRATRCARPSTTPSSATTSRSRGRIQVQYERELDRAGRRREGRRKRSSCSRTSICSRRCRRSSGTRSRSSAPMAVYGSGETIVRQGEDGQSMFVVLSGTVSVVLRAVARGGRAHRARRLLRRDVAADRRAALGHGARGRRRRRRRDRRRSVPPPRARAHPEAIEKIGMAAVVRRAGLEQMQTATAGAVTASSHDADDADEEVPPAA